MVILAATGGAVIAWLRERSATPVPTNPPEWPPLPVADTPEPRGSESTAGDSGISPPLRSVPADSDLADSDPMVSAGVDTQWREPNDDGSCPAGFPVKANSSGIYHLHDGRFYDRTNPQRCYADATDAETDGYRRSKS